MVRCGIWKSRRYREREGALTINGGFELIEPKVVDVEDVAEIIEGSRDNRTRLGRSQKTDVINDGGAYKGRKPFAMATEDISKGAHK